MVLQLVLFQLVWKLALPRAVGTPQQLPSVEAHVGLEPLRSREFLVAFWALKRWLAVGRPVPFQLVLGKEGLLACFTVPALSLLVDFQHVSSPREVITKDLRVVIQFIPENPPENLSLLSNITTNSHMWK